jgi:hypothetical protein
MELKFENFHKNEKLFKKLTSKVNEGSRKSNLENDHRRGASKISKFEFVCKATTFKEEKLLSKNDFKRR